MNRRWLWLIIPASMLAGGFLALYGFGVVIRLLYGGPD